MDATFSNDSALAFELLHRSIMARHHTPSFLLWLYGIASEEAGDRIKKSAASRRGGGPIGAALRTISSSHILLDLSKTVYSRKLSKNAGRGMARMIREMTPVAGWRNTSFQRCLLGLGASESDRAPKRGGLHSEVLQVLCCAKADRFQSSLEKSEWLVVELY